MKKIISVVIIGIFLFCSTPHAIADSSKVSLSDAVIADLALRNYLNNVSVSMIDGKDKTVINVNQNKQWIPASTIKMYVAMYAYNQIENGALHTWDTVTMDGKNVVTTELETPELPALYVGEEVSIQRLIKQMITQSDNSAYNQLLDVLDRRSIAEYVHNLGLSHTEIGSKLNLDDNQGQYEEASDGFGINTTTSEDYAKAFALIKDNKVPYAQTLLDVLKMQKINDMLPALLPNDLVIAHKTGDWDPLYHDGGIIYPHGEKDPYILSVFTNLGDPTIVAHISQLVYSQDLTLVGQVLAATSNEPLQALDELLKHPPVPTITPAPTKVLGLSNFISQTISAADLGINANDLSLSVNPNDLPKVIVPPDSPLHNYVTLWYAAKKAFAGNAANQAKVDLEALNLQVAEAQTLQKEGKTQQQNEILTNVQNQLQKIAESKTIADNPTLQTGVEQVSQQRFTLLKTNLTQAPPEERNAIIQTIAQQAKETVTTVEPNLPQASREANPAQQPLIGTVIQKTDDKIVVKTPGGQEITIPTNQNTVKVRSAVPTEQLTPTPSAIETPTESIAPTDETTPIVSPTPSAATIDSVQTGTTIAVIGTAQGSTFHPTFMLTNVPRELVAPQPVTVVKVNTKNDTMIVSENGVLTQVDLNKQTIIKADNTNLSLPSIKAGDTVVVHGSPVEHPTTIDVTPTPTNSTTQPTVVPTTSQNNNLKPTITLVVSPSPVSAKSGALVTVAPTTSKITPTPISTKGVTPTVAAKVPTAVPAVVTTQSKTTTVVATTAPKAVPTTPPATTKETTTAPVTPAPVVTTPQVVVGKTIQVIDTKQQQVSVPTAPAPAKPAASTPAPAAPVNNPAPAAAAPAAPAPAKPASNPAPAAPAASAPNPPAVAIPAPATDTKK